MNKEKLGKTKPIGCAFTAGSDPTSMLFSIHVPEHKNSRVRDMESVSQGVNVCTGSPRKHETCRFLHSIFDLINKLGLG